MRKKPNAASPNESKPPRKKTSKGKSGLSKIAPTSETNPSAIQDLLLDLVSNVPASTEVENVDPLSRSRAIARNAAVMAASVSSVLALPPGPLGIAAILPDLLGVWKIQKQMVADIAAVYGKTSLLNKEMMVFCLFKHGAAMLMRDFAARVGERLLIRRVTLRTLQQALQKIGVRITQKVISKAITRYVPLVGALALGGYSYYDTSKVAATAIDAFSREIILEDEEP